MARLSFKKVAALGVGVVAAVTLTAAPASAETTVASPSEEAAIQACTYTTKPANPYRIGYQVRGAAYSSGCPSNWTFNSYLQRSRWYGWEDMDHHRWTGSGGRVLGFDCSGQYEYRVRFQFFNGVSNSGTHYSNVVTLPC